MRAKVTCLVAGVLSAVCVSAASAATAQAATVSGVVTDINTGAPIAGATVYALGQGNNYGPVSTDSTGHWTRQLAPGSYWLDVEASGYYKQPIGVAPADGTTETDHLVTANGPNQFNTTMVPETEPYAGVAEASLSWSHATSSGPPGTNPSPQPFAAMVFHLRSGVYASVPRTWPADELIGRMVDTSGDVVPESEEHLKLSAAGGGGSGGGFAVGSAVGCEYRTGKTGWNPTQLRVEAYLASAAQRVAIQPVAVDRSGCEKTRMHAYWQRPVRRKHAMLIVAIYGRAPNNAPVPGKLIFHIDHHRHVTAHVSSGSGNGDIYSPSEQVSRNVARLLRTGSNRVRVTFTPSVAGYDAPKPRTLKIHIKRRHKRNCHRTRRCRRRKRER